MNLPTAIKALLATFADRFPIPQGAPGDEHEERVRQWTIRFCEQVAFSFPNQGYGGKKSFEGYPVSKDSLARKTTTLESWDLLGGVGTGNPQLSPDPEYHHIPTQVFVVVPAVNHLGGAPSPTPPPPPSPQPPAPPPSPGITEPDAQRLSSDIDAAYHAQAGRPMHRELVTFLLFRYLREGYTRNALIAEATARGKAEA